MASATVQESPPLIQLFWSQRSDITSYDIYRKGFSDTDWHDIIASPTGSETGYTDTNVDVGVAYEYKIVGHIGYTNTAFGYVATGIDLPLVEDRGKVILLVEKVTAASLTTELKQLIADLIGDGWTVIRHDVSTTTPVTQVKSTVSTDYYADPARVKALFIFGHVPIPKSGWLIPDGHFFRPFPTDLYYGVIGGSWTDTQNYGPANQANDGIFDQSSLNEVSGYTAPVTLQVGRVDLWNLPTFDATALEVERLRNYLNKDHNYRMNAFAMQQKGFVQDNFGSYTEGFSQSGLRSFSAFFGPDNVVVDTWTNPKITTPYLWGYGCGGGTYTSASGVAQTSDMLTYDPAVFTMLFGSYFGEWDASDDFMRAELATAHYGLTCCWAGRPNWFFHRMGTGEQIGESARLTQNNGNYFYEWVGSSVGQLHVCLMGDPTLRLTMLAPPKNTVATQVGAHTIHITWDPSDDPDVIGYNIYRVLPPNGPAVPVNTMLINDVVFDDTAPKRGINTYMVRAVKLETSTGSSYFNASEGAIANGIIPVFTPPTTLPKSYATKQDVPLSITTPGVLTGDTSAGGDPMTVQKVTDPANGTLTLNSDGSFLYTPAAGYHGIDTFTYRDYDGFTYSAATTVTIIVHGLPTANFDNYATPVNTALIVAAPGVLANDSDPEGSVTLTAKKVTDPTHGTLALNADGSFTYTPATGYVGKDSFTYKANNGYGDSNTVVVNLMVDAPPVAGADNYTTKQNAPLTVAAPGVLSNDTDAGKYALIAVIATNPAHGTLMLKQDGSFTYTPVHDFSGSDSFTYMANDGYTNSIAATVAITVTPLPMAKDDSYQVNAGNTLTVPAPGVLGNDSILNGKPLTAVKVSDPANGALTLNADGSFSYLPGSGFHGKDSFTYKANDGANDSNVATVTIVVHPLPVAANDSYSTYHDTTLNVPAPGVLANDQDAENTPLTAVKKSNPAHGTLTFNSDGSFAYVPMPGYSGPDSFTYVANNGFANSNLATVAITLYGTPIAVADSYRLNQNTTLAVAAPGVLSNDTDPNGLAITVKKLSDPVHGTLSLNSNGAFTYAPAHNFVGKDSFTYQLADPILTSTPATVTLTVNPVGFEADVSPRPDGNGSVSVVDWSQIGRFVVGLDTPSSPSEFQRADCAPIATSGNGSLDINDWVQAGRYAAGLDPLQPAGGPTNPVTGTTGARTITARAATVSTTPRRVTLGNGNLTRGSSGTVQVLLSAQGDENALGFTLCYDAKRLRLLGVKAVGAASGATLMVNTSKASNGTVGLLLMLPLPKAFHTGNQPVLECTFTPLPGAPLGKSPISFSDAVVSCAVANTNANTLPAALVNGSMNIVR